MMAFLEQNQIKIKVIIIFLKMKNIFVKTHKIYTNFRNINQ